jgi:hypothetical protein
VGLIHTKRTPEECFPAVSWCGFCAQSHRCRYSLCTRMSSRQAIRRIVKCLLLQECREGTEGRSWAARQPCFQGLRRCQYVADCSRLHRGEEGPVWRCCATSPHDMADFHACRYAAPVNLPQGPTRLCLGSHPENGALRRLWASPAQMYAHTGCTPPAILPPGLRCCFQPPLGRCRARAVGLPLLVSPSGATLSLRTGFLTPLSPFRSIHHWGTGYCLYPCTYCPVGTTMLHF